MPYPKRFVFLGDSVFRLYLGVYNKYEAAVVEYHKAALRDLDISFRTWEATAELQRSRSEARATGMGSAHPDYPPLRL
jgi:hypothetical protein